MGDDRIPGYEILEKIGEGAMGLVYRARQQRTGDLVAIKLLPRFLWETTTGKGRFLREAILLSTLRHPNICQLVDSGDTDDGRFFFATELLLGPTLEQRMIREEFSLQKAVSIAMQVAAGLEMAHDVGVIHRDIKPANLIVLSDGTVKILDFGLARLEAAADLSVAGEVMGTATYASPEQLRGESCDAKCDIWAVGVILYEMVAGLVPFPGGNDAEVARAVMHKEPERLDSRRPDAPEALQAIVSTALAKESSDRQESAGQLRGQLEEVLAELADRESFPAEVQSAAREPQKDPSLAGRLRRFFA